MDAVFEQFWRAGNGAVGPYVNFDGGRARNLVRQGAECRRGEDLKAHESDAGLLERFTRDLQAHSSGIVSVAAASARGGAREGRPSHSRIFRVASGG